MQHQNQTEQYPEYCYDTCRDAKYRKILKSIGFLATGAILVTIGHFLPIEGPATASAGQVNTEATQNYAESVQAAQAAQIRAKIIAESINKTIDNAGSSSSANVLNGIIINNVLPDKSNGNTGYSYSYRDVYLLSDINFSNLDPSGNFLDGKWFGVTSNDSTGKIMISPMMFDPNTMTFKANKTGSSPVINAVLQASIVNFVPGPSAYEAFAFDSQSHQTLVNDDGTQFEAGYVTRIN